MIYKDESRVVSPRKGIAITSTQMERIGLHARHGILLSWPITGTFDFVRYWYVNGRPSRVEIASVNPDRQTLNCSPNCYTTYYIQYNWHGDATVFTDASNGNIYGGNNGWVAYDPWGNGSLPSPSSIADWDYYKWSGGWGYLYFKVLGMYYVHGRWYRPDLGLFISPDSRGEYFYNSNQDAVNYAWFRPDTNSGSVPLTASPNPPLFVSSWMKDFIRTNKDQINNSAGRHGLPPELVCAVLCNEGENNQGKIFFQYLFASPRVTRCCLRHCGFHDL